MYKSKKKIIIKLLGGYESFLESRKATNNFEREELFLCKKTLKELRANMKKLEDKKKSSSKKGKDNKSLKSGGKYINEKKAKKENIEAYVDGSFNIKNFNSSYGVVIIDVDKIYEYNGKVQDKKVIEMRNVAGEISAAIFAMNWCIKHKKKNVIIYYDYAGIEKWCTGEWKAKKEATKKYKAYYNKICEKVNIKFIKVKSHSKNVYNDRADELAKEALI